MIGRSLGGAIALWLAEQKPEAGALVVESAFTSIPDMAAEVYPFLPVRLLVFPEFAHAAPVYLTAAELRRHLTVPIPNEHTERYAEVARELRPGPAVAGGGVRDGGGRVVPAREPHLPLRRGTGAREGGRVVEPGRPGGAAGRAEDGVAVAFEPAGLRRGGDEDEGQSGGDRLGGHDGCSPE